MTESTTPLGCGSEGAVSDHAELLNALEDMAGSYTYAVRKQVLRNAGRTIMALERKCNELREEMERDGVAVEAENGALHDALTERDEARQALSDSLDPRTGVVGEIAAERERQKGAEGFETEHDDEHNRGELAYAAACYAFVAGDQGRGESSEWRAPLVYWPWDQSWWKPKDARRNLVRAAALIVAEIERLDRAGKAPK